MSESVIVIIFAVMVLFLIAVLLGLAKKVVFYYDEGDMVLSLMPWLSLIVTLILLAIFQPEGTSFDMNALTNKQTTIGYIGLVVTFIFIIFTILKSIKYNKSLIIGTIVGIFKLLFSLFGIVILVGQAMKMKDEKTKRNQFWFALLFFGAIWWLGDKLINGKKVYRERGWGNP